MALAELNINPERSLVTPELISYLRARSNEQIGVVAFVNHLNKRMPQEPHYDDYHFELVTESKRSKILKSTGTAIYPFVLTRFNKRAFTNALNWFEEEMQYMTGTAEKIEAVESGAKWKTEQEQRFVRANAHIIPEVKTVLNGLAEMKTKLWIAHAPSLRK
jgi:hypothetical protein